MATMTLTSKRFIGLVAAALMVGLGWQVEPAAAQGQIQQDGRLFDANPMLGSGGTNYTRPSTSVVGGNLYLTGNVRRGMAFQGYSPIGDPLGFRGELGSGSLSAFRRNAVSAADPSLGQLGAGAGRFTPYYDPATTVPTSAYLRNTGLGAGTTQLPVLRRQASSSTMADILGDQRAPTSLDLGVNPTQTPSPNRVNRFEGPGATAAYTTNTIFSLAATNARPSTLMDDGEETFDPRRTLTGWDDDRTTTGVDGDRRATGNSLDMRVRPSLDSVLGRHALGTVTRGADGAPLSAAAQRDRGLATILGRQPAATDDGPEEGTTALNVLRDPAQPRVDPSVLPGYDLYGDLRIAMELKRAPDAEWFNEMKDAAAVQPDQLREQITDLSEVEGEEFADQVLSQRVVTLAGRGDSALNEQLRRAEQLCDEGRYFEAAAMFESAARLAPANPLPEIGRANALLAGGEYDSAAGALVRTVERFPEIAQLQFDLAELMGGGEIVDIRRADLMKRLETREDATLRFLLGYLEYFGGYRERGLANLREAADEARPTSAMARFPELLGATAAPTQP